MGVYTASGSDLFGAVYDMESNRLYQAYDSNAIPLIDTGLIINRDASTGTDSGYTLTSALTGNTYIMRLIADWGAFSFQSAIIDTEDDAFCRMTTTATVARYEEDMTALASVTLGSTGGHKNDAAYYNGAMYMMDGTAGSPKALYVWDTSGTSVTAVTVPVQNNENGSVRVVAGISKSATNGMLYLVSKDNYNNNELAHQDGDVMCVYAYDIEQNTVELLATFPWDCVYIQGATYHNGILYVTCNTQTTGSASNYTGITIKCIRTDTWELIDTLTCSGNFEPEGMDTVTFTGGTTELTMGIVKWLSVSKFVRFTPPYELGQAA